MPHANKRALVTKRLYSEVHALLFYYRQKVYQAYYSAARRRAMPL